MVEKYRYQFGLFTFNFLRSKSKCKTRPWFFEIWKLSKELTKITATLGRAAIREASSNVVELELARNNVVMKWLELSDSCVSGGVTDNATVWILPWGLSSGTLVLDQYVGCPDLISQWWGHFRLFAFGVSLPFVFVIVRTICWEGRSCFLSFTVGRLYLCGFDAEPMMFSSAYVKRKFRRNC